MNRQLNHNTKLKRLHFKKPCIGYSDKNTVKVDFDGTPLKTVKFWSFRAYQFFKLHGYTILQSSKGSYHVVFDRSVSWSKNLHVIAWLAQQSKHKKLTGWLLMQCIKESSTLRVGRKGRKGIPKIVFKYGAQNCEIKTFLEYRKMLTRLEERLRK